MPQSLANLLSHAVFSMKDRRAVLNAVLREELFAYLGGTLKNDGSLPVCIGGFEDHVHLLFALSRTRTLADTIGKVKSASSHWIKTKEPRLHNFGWQAGYAAFSVGSRESYAVTQYIQGQAEHHQNLSFQDEMRRFFLDYQIAYDERYVWD